MAKRMVATLGATGAQLPVDSTTGAAMAPDLAPLKKLAEAHTRQPQQPFAADDLDLSPMVRPVSQQQIYRDEGFYTWCNSIIRDKDGTYHLFYVRWPKEHGFYGWLTHSEIARAVSENPAGPYTFRNVVLPSRGEHPWNRITAHNVKITELAGKYYLYFISTSDGGRNATEADLAATARTGYSAPLWQPLRNNQRTGVATADSLDGPWKVHEKPVVEPRGPISNVTVNPAVWQTAENRFHMIVKGDSPASRVAQALAIADNPLG
ncbi:MAG: hypothetical protein EOP83_35920, partial [Verrucomicrobiaceae bacterium]